MIGIRSHILHNQRLRLQVLSLKENPHWGITNNCQKVTANIDMFPFRLIRREERNLRHLSTILSLRRFNLMGITLKTGLAVSFPGSKISDRAIILVSSHRFRYLIAQGIFIERMSNSIFHLFRMKLQILIRRLWHMTKVIG